jgi:hypothetical protein
LFDKTHVSGASASYPEEIFSDESSGDDVAEIQKNSDENVKLSSLKNSKLGKRKRKENTSVTEEKEEKSPSIDYTRTLVRR